MPAKFNLFEFQRRAMPVLLGWASGSIASGLLWLAAPDQWLRGLGSQFAGWGLIDGIIALLALRGAARNADRLAAGAVDAQEHDRQARQFEAIVWANAALDVGYALGGYGLLKRSPDHEGRRGMGVGIMIQGLFLLAWDVALALLVRSKRRAAA